MKEYGISIERPEGRGEKGQIPWGGGGQVPQSGHGRVVVRSRAARRGARGRAGQGAGEG